MVTTVAQTVLLPVGLSMGAFPADPDTTAHQYEIRRGTEVHEVSAEQYAAWAFVHDVHPLWTRVEVERRLPEIGIAEAGPVIDDLLDRRLLAEVAPGGPGAVTFARAHRAVPTMCGMGNLADDPWCYLIGAHGRPAVRVSWPVFDIWAWGHTDGDLWRACQSFAEREHATGGTDPVLRDPAQLLAGFLAALPSLLAAHAVYLDPVAPDE